VTFTVQSYPNRPFEGKVQQVRLNSTTVNNVVSYTAIVAVSMKTASCLPGMTATVKFVTGSADNVLTCRRRRCGSRLRSPTRLRTADSAAFAARRAAMQGGAGAASEGGAGRASRAAAGNRGTVGTLWTVDAAESSCGIA